MVEIIVQAERELYSEEEWTELLDDADTIVRCRDCKYYEHKKFIDYNDNEYEHLCWYFADYENTPAAVRPDGFCAWGEER